MSATRPSRLIIDLPRERVQSTAILTILLAILVVTLTTTVVKASTEFNGTYDYSYNYYGGSSRGWITVKISSGFIVENGRISSNPSGLNGYVDDNGNARFTGPCPYGDPRATFTGVIRSDGTGKGSYICPYGHRGNWVVSIVSRPFSLSAMVPFLVIGTVAVVGIAVGISALKSASKPKQKREFREVIQPTSQTPGPYPRSGARYQPAPRYEPAPTGEWGIPPSPIPMPPPPRSPEAGLSVGPPALPPMLSLRATWAQGQVTLDWDRPQFDAGMYQLVEYDVSMMQYGPTSTAPVKIPLAQLPPNQTQWVQFFTQTYRWNTGGDTQGYVVEAVLRHTSGYRQTVGAMIYAPRPP